MKELALQLGTSTNGLLQLLGVGLVLQLALVLIVIAAKKKPLLGSLMTVFALLEVAAAALFLCWGFDVPAESESDPKMVPAIWSIALMICCAFQMWRLWTSTDVKPVTFGHVNKVFYVLVIVAAAIWLFPYLGFFICTGAMILLMMLLLGERKIVLLVSLPVGWMILTYVIFNKLLLLGLPIGSLFQ